MILGHELVAVCEKDIKFRMKPLTQLTKHKRLPGLLAACKLPISIVNFFVSGLQEWHFDYSYTISASLNYQMLISVRDI